MAMDAFPMELNFLEQTLNETPEDLYFFGEKNKDLETDQTTLRSLGYINCCMAIAMMFLGMLLLADVLSFQEVVVPISPTCSQSQGCTINVSLPTNKELDLLYLGFTELPQAVPTFLRSYDNFNLGSVQACGKFAQNYIFNNRFGLGGHLNPNSTATPCGASAASFPMGKILF